MIRISYCNRSGRMLQRENVLLLMATSSYLVLHIRQEFTFIVLISIPILVKNFKFSTNALPHFDLQRVIKISVVSKKMR